MNDSQLLLEKLEDMFGDEPFGQVEEELFQWFLFAYNARGNNIKDMDNLNLEVFKERLNILIDTIYLWHQDRN
jgi:hypothetical protein